ncbi:hypothetical protein BCR44DRAFT_1099471 [Catenaria anguillulae PL171]|uniref:Uncharacterized protein n=1 Tax=Catenaria anguillulae PL171 TaxID=765915 RepID=A0A1Y2I467_9FUNG|nr:hypothetical protein BCR44DRAFT_1099471 [Catenaria anguillulae PL171]
MQFGMVFAGESCAMYGVGASCSGYSTSTFRVLTGKPGKVFHSSVYHPHPLLRWKQVDRELGVVVDNHRAIRAVQVTSTPDQKVVMIARGLATRLVDGRPAHGTRSFCVGQYSQSAGMGGSDFEFACSRPDAIERVEALMVDVSELLEQFPVVMWPWLRAQTGRDTSSQSPMTSSQSMADRRRAVFFDLGIRFDL